MVFVGAGNGDFLHSSTGILLFPRGKYVMHLEKLILPKYAAMFIFC